MADVVGLFFEDLRLALIALGGVFILGLLGWEALQRRRARRADATHEVGPLGQRRDASAEPVDPLFVPAERSDHELALPEISVRDRLVEPPLVDLEVAAARTERSHSLPVVDSVTIDDADLESPAAQALPAEDPDAPVPLRLSWPPERERRFVALRLVARPGERFTGASLRQALQGEGFQFGEMQIFHRPVVDGRVLLSAASLTRPGSFDLDTMDSNLFLGLNLFAVLPGPLKGRETVDKLLGVGHTLAQRLRGELRDGQGEPLTEARLADMRREAALGEG